MGYETYYELTVSEGGPSHDEMVDYVYGLFGDDSLTRKGDMKQRWYNHDAYMLALSNRWPDVLFTLVARGTENRVEFGRETDLDVWVKYFLGGRVQLERMPLIPAWAPPVFDPSKLGDPNDVVA